MKRSFALFLLTIIFIQSTSQLWITASFFANRDLIARVLCINKDEPGSNCKGACQLKKKIGKDKEDQERSNPDAKAKEVLVYVTFEAEQLPIEAPVYWVERAALKAYFNTSLPQGYLSSIFHPPSAVVQSVF